MTVTVLFHKGIPGNSGVSLATARWYISAQQGRRRTVMLVDSTASGRLQDRRTGSRTVAKAGAIYRVTRTAGRNGSGEPSRPKDNAGVKIQLGARNSSRVENVMRECSYRIGQKVTLRILMNNK